MVKKRFVQSYQKDKKNLEIVAIFLLYVFNKLCDP